jgi:hypothetical protein
MLRSLNSEEAAASDETVAEALAYLLERSGTQEGQLAKLYSDLQCLADRLMNANASGQSCLAS